MEGPHLRSAQQGQQSSLLAREQTTLQRASAYTREAVQSVQLGLLLLEQYTARTEQCLCPGVNQKSWPEVLRWYERYHVEVLSRCYSLARMSR
jgi:hypothetical protein